MRIDYDCVCEPGVHCSRSCQADDGVQIDFGPADVGALTVDGRHPNSARFHQILGELGALHDQKQQDYGRGDDPFANVRGAEEWGVDGWIGAMVRANDKIRRLQNYARTGSLSNEGAEDSFRDLAVYAVIALVLWEQSQAHPVDVLIERVNEYNASHNAT